MPAIEYEQIQKEVGAGKALNAADYVRQAIREKMARDTQKEAIRT